MDITIQPQLLQGELTVIPSKSQAHRLLICAALSKGPVTLHLDGLSRDILATIDCLRALGAEITAAPGTRPAAAMPSAEAAVPRRKSRREMPMVVFLHFLM